METLKLSMALYSHKKAKIIYSFMRSVNAIKSLILLDVVEFDDAYKWPGN